MPGPLPLPTMLSQALVAHTIELDNEAEVRVPHKTTRGDRRRGVPWLVSWALWANVLQYVGPDGITVSGLHAAARTSRSLFAGLQRWGYITIEPPAGEVLNKAPQPAAVVRVTPAGRGAQDVWRALPAVIEERWHARFGSPTVDQLTAALSAVYAALPFDPPAFLPVVYPTQNGKTENPPLRNPGSHGGSAALDLSALLAGVLLAFTVDFESESRISLTISANTLRVLTAEGVRVRDLPGLTGVSKEGNAMAVGWLERRGCAESVPEPGAARGKLVRLTEKGSRAQAKYRRVLRDTEERWRTGYGADALNALSAALHPLVGDGTLASSALAQGLEPAPANWRARVRTPETLPHHPMVLHRGGYPDGS